MRGYTIVIDGKPAGPYSVSELKDLKVKPGTFVRTDGMDDYKEAHEIPELRELLGFKHRITLPQYFATMDIRLLAVAIDYLIIVVVYILVAMVAVTFTETQFLKLIISASGLILIPIAKLVYGAIMESSSRQGTFGKFWLGLKVCDEQGLPVSFEKAAVRNLAKILSSITFGIGYLMGFFDKRQQCLHDKVAGTLVTKGRLI